ncbi:hypothetical protein PoB_005733500 [Plakobranchus ocellatus]|uniref:Uncharacterized protein n=1 Tax=Plakobranchus ocellatus TaxID=259542 RepID=A0AAV4CGI1_9GAST|nr:hypothetical protein PoB_005733500 [Plakobranchus ocellatus]
MQDFAENRKANSRIPKSVHFGKNNQCSTQPSQCPSVGFVRVILSLMLSALRSLRYAAQGISTVNQSDHGKEEPDVETGVLSQAISRSAQHEALLFGMQRIFILGPLQDQIV